MKLHFLLSVTLMLLFKSAAWSQGMYRAGILPQINMNMPLNKQWRLNTRLESRQFFSEGRFGNMFKAAYRYGLTDIALVASRSTGVNSSAGAGYLIRFEDRVMVHRFIQQYSHVKAYDLFRLGQRISTDQTIRSNEPVEFRLRYRISLERALNGKEVDPEEFYCRLNNEYLLSLQGGVSDLESRLLPALGYAVNDNNKFEAGLDYRLGDFVSGASDNQLWLLLSWYVNI